MFNQVIGSVIQATLCHQGFHKRINAVLYYSKRMTKHSVFRAGTQWLCFKEHVELAMFVIPAFLIYWKASIRCASSVFLEIGNVDTLLEPPLLYVQSPFLSLHKKTERYHLKFESFLFSSHSCYSNSSAGHFFFFFFWPFPFFSFGYTLDWRALRSSFVFPHIRLLVGK